MIEQPAAHPLTLRYRAERWLRELDRKAGKHNRTRRLRDLIAEHHPWWDWGHRLMALVGRDDSGNWGPPRVRDLYLRDEWTYPPGVTMGNVDKAQMIHQQEMTRDGWEAWQGARRGETWRSFDSQDDGHTIRVGYLGDDGRLHDTGLNGQREIALFRRWFLWDGWVKAEWFGLRRWLYYKGLHHAVDHRVPFTCGLTTPPGSGGYSHWHCTERVPLRSILTGQRQQHPMPHRFGNYTWGGEPEQRVEYEPIDSPVT